MNVKIPCGLPLPGVTVPRAQPSQKEVATETRKGGAASTEKKQQQIRRATRKEQSNKAWQQKRAIRAIGQ